MAKQNFLGLVKFSGSYEDYQKQQVLGKLVFAEISADPSKGKYIWANGLEYKVADSTDLDGLLQRVNTIDGSIANLEERIADVSQDVIDISTYVHTTVDASIADISTRLSNVGITAANNKLTVNGKDVSLNGNNYVTVTAANNIVDVSLDADKIQDGGSADGHEKLATKGYVDTQMGQLTQALVFKGSVSDEQPLPTEKQKVGDTYVASRAMTNPKADAGDLFIWNGSSWTQVERNLDGAVEASTALGSDYVILGNGDQTVKASTLSINDLNTAIANANSAIQGVNAAAVQNSYVTISVENGNDTSTIDVSAILTVVDTSVALASVAETGSLVDAKAVKDFIDTQAADIKIQATLNSSTTNYVDASASVDESGRVITASVGVKTATLEDASNGSIGLAMAEDVYNELTAVEQTVATAITTMSNTVGLNSDYSVTWSTASGIATDTTIVKAIEEVAKKADEAKQSGVTKFGDATGEISIDTTNSIDGSVKFAMNGSTLQGTVNGWSGLVGKVDTNATNIADVSTSLNDLSTYVRQTVDASIDALQAKDVEIDASIDRLDASVSALESRTITGESAILTNANDEYVNVSATKDDQGNVTIDSSVQLATAIDLTDIKNGTENVTPATATGLATDATVKDYVAYALAWDVIGG